MRLRLVTALGALCTIATNAPAQITEATAAAYVKKVEMPVATQDDLKKQAQDIIDKSYNTVLVDWNTLGGQYNAPSLKYQFQGSLGYKMALSLPVEAKSDVDVAFLYLYRTGNNQPSSPQASRLKESARNVFKNFFPSYTYEIKDPVVVINKGTGASADHFDVAFFGELTAQGTAPPATTCVNTQARNLPCSELNWGVTSGTSSWPANDRLNLTETLNMVFDRAEHTIYSHEAGKIFKEWRYQVYRTPDTDVVAAEKPPSIALVTLLYNYMKTEPAQPTYGKNAFVLLRNTIQKAAVDNFKNGQCTNNPQTFAIIALTYPNDNLLGKLTTAQKQEFCTKLMDFKGALEYATANGTPEAQAISRLQPYLPLFP